MSSDTADLFMLSSQSLTFPPQCYMLLRVLESQKFRCPSFFLFVCFFANPGILYKFPVCCHEGRTFSERVTKANGVCLGHYTFSSGFIIDWRTEARPPPFCVRKYWCCSFSSRNRLLGSFSHPLLNFSFLVFLFFVFFCISCQFGLFSLSRFFHFCPMWLIKKMQNDQWIQHKSINTSRLHNAGTNPESIISEFAVRC